MTVAKQEGIDCLSEIGLETSPFSLAWALNLLAR